MADAIKAHPNYEQIAQNMFNGDAKVNMSNKGLDAGDAWIMGAALEKNDTVTELEAFGCAFGAEGGKAMAEALEANKSMEQISVGNVIVGSTVKLKSSGELCTIHKMHWTGNPCITLSNGSTNDVKPSEFELIPAVLPLKKLRDNTITELDFKNSGLGVDGGMMLAAVLKSNSSVTKVSDCEWLV